MAEDSKCYFKIHDDMHKSSRIKPLTTDRDFLKEKDWLEVLTTALRKRGMKTGAELSHTPLDRYRATHEFEDCLQRDIYGNFQGWAISPTNNYVLIIVTH